MPKAGYGQSRKVGKGKKGKGRTVRPQVADEVHQDQSENLENEDFIDQNATGINPFSEQEMITEEQKEELITKTLQTTNPQAPHNITEYSYKELAYRKDELVDQLVVHFSFDGDIIQNQSEQKREQDEYWEEKAEMDKQMIEQGNQGVVDEHGKPMEQDQMILKRSLRNQFNYSERAAQTFNNPVREKGFKTEPPPTSNFASSANQWKIYDQYMKEYEIIQKKEQQEERERLKGAGGKDKQQKKKTQPKEDPLFSNSMKRSLRLMQRMIVQNTEEVKFHDYRYFQEVADQGDAAKVGSVLPLWRFSTQKSRKKNVTTICWNPRYKDMFAVGYGSYDFLKQSTGLICCFTIKNPTWPEYSFSTESGVMCLDFHPNNPALLAVGCYDGTVMVFDIRSKSNKSIYSSSVRTSKHTDPVWQVSWQKEVDATKQLNFFSISSDGRVMNWSLMKNKLEPQQALKLKLVVDQDKELQVNKEAFLYGLAGGMCFDFSKFDNNKYLVGTQEGKIHLCSKAYSGQYLETYQGHYLAVYAVKWNKYHDRVFLSCSADWTVKMWDCTIKKPIMTFDLGCAVGDIEWAPYSSTVFATVTSSGMLYLYDLYQEKHTYLCEHQTLKKAKGLHVSFNPDDPIILVGDQRGGVNSFKLSGNLVLGPMQPQQEEDTGKDAKAGSKGAAAAAAEQVKVVKKTPQDLEAEKMEHFLSVQDKDLY